MTEICPDLGKVLLVEDSLACTALVREAFSACGRSEALVTVRNGEDATAYLRREGKFAEAERPDLVLLDLNLPGKDGREVLMEIKSDDQLRKIPIVVLTTSRASQDISAAYDLHANGYVVKPDHIDHLFRVIKSIDEFWLQTVEQAPD
jgi:chemotaxis family two-component system response regulator Rcp1